MDSLAILYKRQEDVTSLIESGRLDPKKEYLVRIYTAACQEDEAVAMAKTIKALLPKSGIVGATSVGLMFQDVSYEDETMIIFEHFERSRFAIKHLCHKKDTVREMSLALADFASETSAKLIHIIFSHDFTKAHDLVDGFNRLNSTAALVGGQAGGIFDKGIESYVFDDEGVKSDYVICAAISGSEVKAKSWVNVPHEPISEQFTITGVEGAALKTINNIDAKKWITEQLGLKTLRQYPNYRATVEKDELARFPFVLEGHSGASRILYYNESMGDVCQYFSESPLGTNFKIGYASPQSVAKNAYNICRGLSFHPAESLFHYSCFFRKLYFDNCTEWEMSPYKGYGLCGVYLGGEIGNTGESNECLCGSSVLVATAENDTYIKPDMDCFKTIDSIEDKTKELLDYVLSKQKNISSTSNKRLLNELMLHQERTKNYLYYDPSTGLPNSLKYREDVTEIGLNKICMIKIENVLSILSYMRHEGYYAALNNVIADIKRHLDTLDGTCRFRLYSIDDSALLLAAANDVGENEFKETMDSLFKEFHFYTISDINGVLVNRFILALGNDNLIESVFEALRNTKNSQLPFMLYNDSTAEETPVQEELEILGVLKNALTNDGIVPYFQGVHNNKLGKIDRYEALMRIKNSDGSICMPGKFLPVAKKYHLYSYLSTKMIGKVLDIFKDRNEVVSLNISAYDIGSKPVCSMIMQKLRETKDCSRIIFEIVEAEHLSNIDELISFIKNVRSYGAKIAIDDFGSGYSNFREIIAIKPEYIKIDGDVIKNIGTNETQDAVIDTVVFLADRLGTKLVAEYVETEEIQKLVCAQGIGFSQGFYFSRPAPFESNIEH